MGISYNWQEWWKWRHLYLPKEHSESNNYVLKKMIFLHATELELNVVRKADRVTKEPSIHFAFCLVLLSCPNLVSRPWTACPIFTNGLICHLCQRALALWLPFVVFIREGLCLGCLPGIKWGAPSPYLKKEENWAILQWIRKKCCFGNKKCRSWMVSLGGGKPYTNTFLTILLHYFELLFFFLTFPSHI